MQDGKVISESESIDELIKAANILIGLALPTSCPALNPTDEPRIDVAAVIRAVNFSLYGCIGPGTEYSRVREAAPTPSKAHEATGGDP